MMMAALMMAAAQNENLFNTGAHKARYEPQPQTRKDLPKFQVGDHIIHAHNEKEPSNMPRKEASINQE